MKRLLFTLLFSMSTLFIVHAAKIKADQSKAEFTFKQLFAGASNIEWKQIKEFSVAVFTHKGASMKAFFDAEGNLVSTTRKLQDKKELSALMLKNIEDKYQGWGMTDLMEETNSDNETYYYARITDGIEKIIIKITKAGNVSLFKKE